jgi:UDP:flavonoid glycosyltransferase YjiC (YdhE family)
MQALWHGKPVVAIPYNIDQATIAARLVELGIGFNLNPVGLRDFSDRQRYFDKAVSVPWSEVLDRAARALDDGSMRERARAFQPVLRGSGEPAARAADLVERCATSARSA